MWVMLVMVKGLFFLNCWSSDLLILIFFWVIGILFSFLMFGWVEWMFFLDKSVMEWMDLVLKSLWEEEEVEWMMEDEDWEVVMVVVKVVLISVIFLLFMILIGMFGKFLWVLLLFLNGGNLECEFVIFGGFSKDEMGMWSSYCCNCYMVEF